MPTDDPQLPGRLRDDLKRLYAPETPAIPRSVDLAVLRPRPATRRRRWGVAAGLAAALAGAVTIFALRGRDAERAPQFAQTAGPPLSASDVNRDGVVDIRDALALARSGTASQADIDAVGLAAVRLPEVTR